MMHRQSECPGLVFHRHTIGNLGWRRRVISAKDHPFVKRNADHYDHARMNTPCVRCGYVGPSVVFRVPKGEKGPAQLIQSSEKGYRRAMARSTPICLNCWNDTHGAAPLRKLKGAVPTILGTPVHVVRALEREQSTAPAAPSPAPDLGKLTAELFSEAASARSGATGPDQYPPTPEPKSP